MAYEEEIVNIDDKWAKEITLEDLPFKEKAIAEIIGLANYIEFARIYGGTRIYVNKLEESLKDARDKKISDEYTKYNVNFLAKKYNLTENRIRQIAGDRSMEGQISLFDENAS